jgi:hypothetical protein
MRVLMIGLLSLAATALLDAPAAVRRPDPKPDPVLTAEAVQALKPLPADPADSHLKKLQREAYNNRLAVTQDLLRRLRVGQVRASDVLASLRKIADAEADMRGDPAARIKWLRLCVQVLGEEVVRQEELMKRQGGTQADLLQVRADLLSAQIDVVRAEEATAAGSSRTPAEKLKLYRDRTQVLAELEKMYRDLYAKGAAREADYLEARAVRIEAEIEQVKVEEAQKAGK